jgi:hypothetical protein
VSDLAELRTIVARIGLVSHASTQRYDQDGSRNSEDIAGSKPPGSDRDRPGRAPRPPLTPDDDAPDDIWALFWDAQAEWEPAMRAWDDEHAAWLDSYQRKTPAWFAVELERQAERDPENLLAIIADLLVEARDVLACWERRPLPEGQPPQSMADSEWKFFIGRSDEPTQRLADRYGCTPRWIQKIRRAYRPETRTAA